MQDKVTEASELFKRFVAFGCRPNVIVCATLIKGLCQTGNLSHAFKLLDDMINGECSDVFQPNVVCYASIIGGICKEGFVKKAKVLFLDMKGKRIYPDAFVYNPLIHGYCCTGNWEEAKGLFIEMLD